MASNLDHVAKCKLEFLGWVSLKIQGKPRKAVLGNTYIAWSEKTRPPNVSRTYNCSSASWTAIDAPRKGKDPVHGRTPGRWSNVKPSIATISTSPKLPSCELVDRGDSTDNNLLQSITCYLKCVAAHCTSLHLAHSTSWARTPCRPKDCVSWTMTSPSRIRQIIPCSATEDLLWKCVWKQLIVWN